MTTRLSWLFLAAILLAACADQTPRPDPAPAPIAVEIEPRQRLQQLLEAAERSEGHVRDRHQLQAVELLLQEGQTGAAEDWLQQLARRELSLENSGHFRQLRASLLAATGDARQALKELEDPGLTRISDSLSLERQLALANLKAALLAQTGQHFASARERIFINPLLQADARDANQDAIWHSLMQLQPEEIEQRLRRQPGGELQGWLELARVGRSTRLGLEQQLDRLDAWQRQWPGHPAAARLPDGLELVRELARNQPRQVALLLPLSGPMAQFGHAVRDGFMAAWYEHSARGGHPPVVRIYDTDQDGDLLALYHLAVEQGAEAIIGPLDKQRVQLLHEQPRLPVPTLALNRSDHEGEAPENLYQFGLAPEDEAHQVAASAWQLRHRQALVLAPAGQANQRIIDAFGSHWQALGGVIAGTAEFSGQHDFSDVIRSSLNLQRSEQRAQALRQLLGENIEFTPRRRQDVDMIFLLARAPQARSIKPLLDFHYAADIPVYGISRVYDGAPNARVDRDLDGVFFVDMPWLLMPANELRQSIEKALPRPGYQRLHALGVDAFRLYPRLAQLAGIQGSRFYGETGYLKLNGRREVERELVVAQFRAGTPRLQQERATISRDADHERANDQGH